MSEPGIDSSTVSDSLRMDAPAERQAFHNGGELPKATHVKSHLLPGDIASRVITKVQQYQVECYGTVTSISNFQSTTIPRLRLSTM